LSEKLNKLEVANSTRETWFVNVPIFLDEESWRISNDPLPALTSYRYEKNEYDTWRIMKQAISLIEGQTDVIERH
jgi:hypothetical protein